MVDEVPAAELVVVGQLVVDLQHDLIEIHRAGARDLMLASAADSSKVTHQFHRRRIETRDGDLIARERLTGQRIANRHVARSTAGGKVAVALVVGRREHGRCCRLVLEERALPADKEERAIRAVVAWQLHRAAEKAPVLPAIEGIGLDREVIARIEGFVPHVAERAPVKVVGARASDGIDDCAGAVALSRAVVAGLNTELLQRFREWEGQVFVLVQIGVARAVQSKRHRECLRAVRAQPQGARDRLAGFRADRRDDGAGDERRQFRRVAPIERQLDDARVVDDFAQRRRRQVNVCGLAGDADCLTELAELERQVHREAEVGGQLDGCAFDGPETSKHRSDFIGRRPQRRKCVEPIGSADGVAREACLRLDRGDRRPRHDAPSASVMTPLICPWT